jgi:geranylgeranyl pyrophosphate synthase
LPATPSARELRLLKALCIYWGLAYQASDDLADLIGATATTGKTPGRDRALSRPNLAVALGVPPTRQRVARLSALATKTIDSLIGGHPRWSYLTAFHEHVVPSPAGALVNAA